jgi:ribokinase
LTLAGELQRASGGKAANAAVMARRLGADVVLMGCVGDDELAEQALRGLRQASIDPSGVRQRSGNSGLSMISVLPGGDKGIVLALGANESWDDEAGAVGDAVAAASPGSVIVLDLEVPPLLVDAAIAGACRPGAAIVVDPSPADRATPDVVGAADHITPDHREASRITGIGVNTPADGAAAAVELRHRGAGAAYVKLPSGGCALAWSGGQVFVESPTVEVIDTTGAGDAFAGALAWALLNGSEPPDAAVVAVAAASCAVGIFGGQASLPSRQALDAMSAQVTVHPMDDVSR